MFAALKKSKELSSEIERLQNVLEALDMPVWQRGEDKKIIDCNNAYRKLSETESENTEINDLNKEAAELAERCFNHKLPQNKRLKIISEGNIQIYEVCEIPTEDGSIGFAKNVDELSKVQDELKTNEEVQKQLLETSASAIAVYGADEKLKFFNNAFMNLWKLEEAWLGAQPTYGEVLEALREKRKLPEQADFRTFKQENLGLFKDLIDPKEDFYFLPDETALRVIIVPHALGGLQFVYEDMTDKLALERSYNTLLAVQSETLDNLHEGVAVFGESGRLTLSNPIYAGIWGLEKDFLDTEPYLADILDKTKELYKFENHWDEFKQETLARILNREQISENLVLSSGIVLDMKTIPLPDGEVLVTYNDITDSFLVEKSLRETNEALADVDRLKTEFLTNISYELRSPLTSIIGFTEILRQGIFGDLNKEQKEYLEDIYKASHQLEALINDILDISSIEAGYMKLNIDRFDIHAMMAAVIALVKERMQEHNLAFEFDCSPEIGKMFGDETRIKQVLFNILSNAIKFTPVGGTVTLQAEEVGDNFITITIEDSGEGIGETELENIFKKFQKTKDKGGTGLGLSVAKNFIELHGGDIDVESELGKGTKVKITLPRENKELIEEHQAEVI